jgi:hypothetical protein
MKEKYFKLEEVSLPFDELTLDDDELLVVKGGDRYHRVLFGFTYNFQKGKQQQQYRQKNVKSYNDKVDVEAKSY